MRTGVKKNLLAISRMVSMWTLVETTAEIMGRYRVCWGRSDAVRGF